MNKNTLILRHHDFDNTWNLIDGENVIETYASKKNIMAIYTRVYRDNYDLVIE